MTMMNAPARFTDGRNKRSPTASILPRNIFSLAKFPVISEIEVKALWGTKSTVVGQLVVSPLVYTALLAAGLQGLIGQSGIGAGDVSYLTFAFPGILGLQVIAGCNRTIYRSTVDRRWGLLAQKRLAGVGSMGYVLGMTVAPIVAFLVQAAVATPVALWLGARATPAAWVATVALGAAFIGFWAGLGIIVTAAVRNYEQRDLIINLSMLPLTFSAPVFYTLDQAPRYLRILGSFNPLSYQVTAMRNTFLGTFERSALLVAILLSLFSIIVASLLIERGEPLGAEI